MKTIYTFIFIILAIFTYAQPQIKFDLTEYDFGRFETAGTIKKEFTFTNTGNKPLIITRVRTGDGGSYATYPREPIMPNEKGIITFVYNSQRIGLFRKRIMVTSNASNNYGSGIKIIGEVIHRPTQISLSIDTIDIGKISFGMIDTTTFEIKNIGQEKLYLQFLNQGYYEHDIFFQNLKSTIQFDGKERQRITSYPPSTSAKATIVFRNIYGNTGDFQRKIYLKYNSYDTVFVIIKGQYIGQPAQETIYESKSILHYKNGQLQTKTMTNSTGSIHQINYFKDSYCTQSNTFSWKTGEVSIERYFDKGKLVKKTLHEERN